MSLQFTVCFHLYAVSRCVCFFTGSVTYVRNKYTKLYKNRLSNVRNKLCNNKTEENILIWMRVIISQLHSNIALTVGVAAAQSFCASLQKYNMKESKKNIHKNSRKNMCQWVTLVSAKQKVLYHSEQSECVWLIFVVQHIFGFVQKYSPMCYASYTLFFFCSLKLR